MKTQGMTSRALLLGLALLVVSIAPSLAQVGAADPAALLMRLQTRVDKYKMPMDAKESLEADLDAVDAVLSDGDAHGAAIELGAFLKDIGGENGKGLSDTQSAALVKDARSLMTALTQGH